MFCGFAVRLIVGGLDVFGDFRFLGLGWLGFLGFVAGFGGLICLLELGSGVFRVLA